MNADRDSRRSLPAAEAGVDALGTASVLGVPAESERDLRVAPEVAGRADRVVAGFLGRLRAADVRDEEFGRLAAELARIGEREMVATTQLSSRFVDLPLSAKHGILGPGTPVARSLAELREIVEGLALRLDEFGPPDRRAPLGRNRHGPADAAAERYGKVQQHLAAVVARLDAHRIELIRDTAAIEQEQRSLWPEMESLRSYAHLAARLDDALERHIGEVEGTDPGRAAALRADLLFAVRQRRRDLLTQLAVVSQGFEALRIVEHNNREVIRAIRAATTTTVAALRTAMLAARATAARRQLDEQLSAARKAGARPEDSTPRGATAGPIAAAGANRAAALRRTWGAVIATLDQVDRSMLEATAALRASAAELGGSDPAVRAADHAAADHAAEPADAHPAAEPAGEPRHGA